MQGFSCIIVDDDKWALVDMRSNIAFEQAGFELVGEYLNSQDALTSIIASPPDLVITDISMGGMNGLDLVEECHRLGSPSVFIVISGHSDFVYAQRALNIGVSHFMSKPVDAGEALYMLWKVRDQLLAKRDVTYVPQHRRMGEILQHIRKHFMEELTLDEMSERFFINKSYLSEMFKKETGKSFVHFKNELRIEHAKVLLRSTDVSINAISQQCGFRDAGYFATVFKASTSKTPQQYRKRESD